MCLKGEDLDYLILEALLFQILHASIIITTTRLMRYNPHKRINSHFFTPQILTPKYQTQTNIDSNSDPNMLKSNPNTKYPLKKVALLRD